VGGLAITLDDGPRGSSGRVAELVKAGRAVGRLTAAAMKAVQPAAGRVSLPVEALLPRPLGGDEMARAADAIVGRHRQSQRLTGRSWHGPAEASSDLSGATPRSAVSVQALVQAIGHDVDGTLRGKGLTAELELVRAHLGVLPVAVAEGVHARASRGSVEATARIHTLISGYWIRVR